MYNNQSNKTSPDSPVSGKIELVLQNMQEAMYYHFGEMSLQAPFYKEFWVELSLDELFLFRRSYFSDVSLLEQEESWAVFRSVKIP